ncbi:unnamed protein product [Symbiodinium natans]|uniref:Uncharacterized protein n=1 Tax=Symbiodinium natans TaxID=878477 RepID=A0A812SMH2_9DINO|nr:unnamed protein product [Symbiodinium natans]
MPGFSRRGRAQVVITEQLRFLGAVQHLYLSNLVFYVCQEGCRDLTDAVRFGMDYSYAAVTFGHYSLDPAKRVSVLSPVTHATNLRKSLDQSHRHWLTRDVRGLSPTSDINGCFDKGPDQFFPGRFQKTGALEPSPYYLQHLEQKVLRADAEEIAAALSRASQPDLNAWDGRGETLLHKAATRGRPEVMAPLVLAAADANCRAKDGRRPLDHVPRGPGNDLARALLMLAGGEDNVPLAEIMKVVEAVPEPWRRQLCSRFGLATVPDIWIAPATEGRLAKSAQFLFAPSLDEEAAATPGAQEALAALRRGIRRPQEERRQLLRRLLREWHPDKFQTLSQEKQEHANTVFCFIQRFRAIFLGEAFDFSVEADAQDGGKSCKPIPDEFLNALAGASGEGELPGSASRCAPVAYSAEGARRWGSEGWNLFMSKDQNRAMAFFSRLGPRLAGGVLAGGGAAFAAQQWHSKGSRCEMTTLTRISYTSTMRGDPQKASRQMEEIVAKSVKSNLSCQVSGHMCYDEKLKHVWQVFEGSPEAVQKLWASINQDERHIVDEDTVTMESVDSRSFPIGWGMRCTNFGQGSSACEDCAKSKLMQLMYKSVIKEGDESAKGLVDKIVPQAMVKNARNGITGWMLYNDRTSVVYQVLEGPPESIERLWERISTDPRHSIVTDSVRRRAIPAREFANWSMAMKEVERTAWMAPWQGAGLLTVLPEAECLLGSRPGSVQRRQEESFFFKVSLRELSQNPAGNAVLDHSEEGKISLQKFQAFVGKMGGIRQLFEQRRLRISTSRKDVCDYIGIAEGARVRAHYFVQGQKSHGWREAQVLKVGVHMYFGKTDMGPGTFGVLLQFGFGTDSTRKWTARQVVPPAWILSGVEDASVASALRESGILDEQQAFWGLLLPETEMQAIARLESCQRKALYTVRAQATRLHDEALPRLRERFTKLGHGDEMLGTVLDWIQDLAPVVVHVHMDRVGAFMEIDEYYRNQFETKTSCGALDPENRTRQNWERELFGGAYDDAKPFDRCKYGALSVMNDYRGVVSARQYGDSYLVLKDVRLRCTFASTDSGGIQGSRLAVLDKYAHVLNEYNDQELQGVILVASHARAGASKGTVRPELLRGSTEDPVMDWVTLGYPQLAQGSGKYYFEVHLIAGAEAPQVGLLSQDFKRQPGAHSTQGVGDCENGWAVDGQSAIRWHRGEALPWGQTWPSTEGTRRLSEDVTVCVAVDLDQRKMYFATDGQWDSKWMEMPTFDQDLIPKGLKVYPAMSIKGRASFDFGPCSLMSWYWKYKPPTRKGVDVPHIGNSETRNAELPWASLCTEKTPGQCSDELPPLLRRPLHSLLSIYKEVQIHGEISRSHGLKRNVQRLVAARKCLPQDLLRDISVPIHCHNAHMLRVSNATVCNGLRHQGFAADVVAKILAKQEF